VVTVAMSEDWLLSGLAGDAAHGRHRCSRIAVHDRPARRPAVVAVQLPDEGGTGVADREAHYRLLANNIADVIILIDARGILRFVSQSVEPVLGLRGPELIGTSCLDLVHPDDKESVRAASARLSGPGAVSTTAFRIIRRDGTVVWVESNFKLASQGDTVAEMEFVGVLRDITERKRMEDELNLLNRRLTQLAATDGLTGLTNRRTFDGFLRREYEACGKDFGAAVRYRQFQRL